MTLARSPLLTVLLSAVTLTLSACSDDPETSLADAQAAFDDHRFTVARDALGEILAHEEQQPEALLLMIRTALELGDGYMAERYLDQLPREAVSPLERVELQAQTEIIKGQPRQALAALAAGPPRDRWTGETYALLVWAYHEDGSLGENYRELDEALERFPADPSVNALAAREYKRLNNWPNVELAVEAALAADPENFEARLIAGELAIRAGELERALSIYQELSKDFPEHAVPLTNVAGLQIDLDRNSAAERTLTRAIALHPDYPMLKFQHARLLYAKGQYEQARRQLQEMQIPVESYKPALILSAQLSLRLGYKEQATVQLLRAAADPFYADEARAIMKREGIAG